MVIDLHAHYVPAALAEQLRARSQVPRIEPMPDSSERLLMPIGMLAFADDFIDLASRLEQMDRWGIDRQLLSLPGLFGIDSLALDEALPMVRMFNDDCAAQCARWPRRFTGLAALPLADTDAAIAELRRGCRELGLLGCILPVDGFASCAAADRLAPIFEAANTLGAHVFVHPGRVAGGGRPPSEPPDCPLARRALAVQHDIGEAMVTLLLSDFLDAYPNVRVHVANLGGTFAAAVERMDHMVALRDPTLELPSRRTGRVWVDCASLGARALEQAVAVFGMDRVVLGTDCPIFDSARTLAGVREARLSTDAHERILGRNAEVLLASAC